MSNDRRDNTRGEDNDGPGAAGRICGAAGPSCEELTDHIVSLIIARDAFDDRPALKAAVQAHLNICPSCSTKGRALRSALAAMAPPSPETTEWAWNVLRDAARRQADPAP